MNYRTIMPTSANQNPYYPVLLQPPRQSHGKRPTTSSPPSCTLTSATSTQKKCARKYRTMPTGTKKNRRLACQYTRLVRPSARREAGSAAGVGGDAQGRSADSWRCCRPRGSGCGSAAAAARSGPPTWSAPVSRAGPAGLPRFSSPLPRCSRSSTPPWPGPGRQALGS